MVRESQTAVWGGRLAEGTAGARALAGGGGMTAQQCPGLARAGSCGPCSRMDMWAQEGGGALDPTLLTASPGSFSPWLTRSRCHQLPSRRLSWTRRSWTPRRGPCWLLPATPSHSPAAWPRQARRTEVPRLPAGLPSVFSLLNLEFLRWASPAPDHAACPHGSLPPMALVNSGVSQGGGTSLPSGNPHSPRVLPGPERDGPSDLNLPLPLPPNQVRTTFQELRAGGHL